MSSSSSSTRPAPGYRRKPLTVACVQFDPKFGDVEGNAKRIRELTSRIQPNKIDLLVLPEMCLTGYMYKSSSEIASVLENPRTGPTATLSSELARRCACWVVAGYPEKSQVSAGLDTTEDDDMEIEDDDGETTEPTAGVARQGGQTGSATGDREEEEIVAYNSAVIVSPQGTVYDTYRKSFLFDTDKTWAQEGDGFKVLDLPEPLGRTVIGICMDMNPRDFLAPFDAYELGNFVRKTRADLLVVPMNWLEPPGEPPLDAPPSSETEETQDGPEMSTLNYWAHRLMPLHDPTPTYTPDGLKDVQPGKDVVFVACNRVGTERGTTFVGTSCVMSITSLPSGIDLIEAMGSKEEGVMFALVN